MAEAANDLKPIIHQVTAGAYLTLYEASRALDIIMTGGATPAQVAALLTALRMRGETAAEIAGFAKTMRKHCLQVELADDPRPVVDTCGTGGDKAGTFNISTTAAFVVAGAGVRVAKHGNRSMTSKCGSADVLEGLGVRVELTPPEVACCVNETGFGFMFAQAFHPAMKHVGPVRREIGIRTIFNSLGPLTNPAGVRRQLIGASDRRALPLLAEVLALLDTERVLFVTSHDGLDEIGISGPTEIIEFDRARGTSVSYEIEPTAFGFQIAERDAILGGTVAQNVEISRSVLRGDGGPRRDVTLINAGAAIYTAGAADSIEEGIQMAAVAIDSGNARTVQEHVVEYTNTSLV
jgi:anthranilate phosphoribosyltransferase